MKLYILRWLLYKSFYLPLPWLQQWLWNKKTDEFIKGLKQQSDYGW